MLRYEDFLDNISAAQNKVTVNILATSNDSKFLKTIQGRNRWIHEQYNNHPDKSATNIAKEYKQLTGIELSDSTIRMVAKRYQQDHYPNTPLPKRTRGRKKGQ